MSDWLQKWKSVFSSFCVFASVKKITSQWQRIRIWNTAVIQLETACCCFCLFSLPPLGSCHSEKDCHWKEGMPHRLARLRFNWLHSPETETQKKLSKLKWQWCKKWSPSSPSLNFPACVTLPYRAHQRMCLGRTHAEEHSGLLSSSVLGREGMQKGIARDNVLP